MTPVSVGSMRSVSRGWSGARERAAALVFWCFGAGCEPIHFRTPSMRLNVRAVSALGEQCVIGRSDGMVWAGLTGTGSVGPYRGDRTGYD
jgi:hypothetical protein